MKLHYRQDTDSLHIDLADATSADSQEIADHFGGDYDTDGRVVGLDIQHASKQLDFGRIETAHLPQPIASAS